MNRHWVSMGLTAVLLICPGSKADYIVTTNMNGADAEVREEEISPNTDPLLAPIGVSFGTQRGASTELGTRAKDSTSNSGDRSSLIYLKFDISDANGVTDALLAQRSQTLLQLTTRNPGQSRWNRIHHRNPYYGTLPADTTNPDFVAFASHPGNYTRVEFNVYGLQNFTHPRYNWSESGVPTTWDPVTSPTNGPLGSITFYNAPGITPDSRLTPNQDPGKYNVNSDMRLLGTATLEDPGLPYAVPPPFPPVPGAVSAALCVGCVALDFEDADGALHDLIVEARNAGQTHVTLAVHFSLNASQNAIGETAQITPNDFLNFNYLFNPKEMDGNTSLPGLQLNTDPSWNPDWTDLVPPAGPDNMATGPGPFSGASNDGGRFSPRLVFLMPEIPLGDYNQNGTVDAADYTVWRDHLGQNFTLTGENPAAATPGVVDAEDYDFWKSHFGQTIGSGSAGLAPGGSPGAKYAVPEPAALGSALAALFMCALLRRGSWR